jgi:hemerythrin superfamily protein
MAKQTQALEELHVDELRDRAKTAGITGTSHMRKDELIEVLRHDDEPPARRPTAKNGASDDVLAVLKQDHDNVKALFEQAFAKEAGDAAIADIVRQIVSELKLHTEAEETIFYPALKAKAIDGDAEDAKEEVLEAYVEHGSVKELIAQIEELTPADESYKAVLTVMSELVQHHVEEEESEMFKRARKLLAKDELSSIGEQVTALKESAKSAV